MAVRSLSADANSSPRDSRIAWVAEAAREGLLSLGVSDREVAECSGHSRSSVAKVRTGRPVRPDVLFDIRRTLDILEQHSAGPTPLDGPTPLAPRVWAVPANGLPALVAS